jgi:site-specific recombinase
MIIARDIAERTAASGDQFIAQTRAQYLKLLKAGSGGGLITLLTVIGKYLIFWLRIPAILGGALIATNYAVSFLLIYALSFKLVTKQPAIAGAALARVLENLETQGTQLERSQSVRKALRYFAAIVRSITVTAATNLALVFSSVIVFHLGYKALHHGRSFLDLETSRHMIESLHPFQSMTIPCAAATGGLLWLSSQIGGWFEHLAHKGNSTGNSLCKSLGSGRAYGIASSISLGVLFSTLPIFGHFLGVSLDVRHMTLSAGALMLALCSVGIHEAWNAGLVSAFFGLVLITALNLGVAFILGLMTSIHARGVDRSVVQRLFRALRSNLGLLISPRLAFNKFFLS